jgi:hypothetical protein
MQRGQAEARSTTNADHPGMSAMPMRRRPKLNATNSSIRRIFRLLGTPAAGRQPRTGRGRPRPGDAGYSSGAAGIGQDASAVNLAPSRTQGLVPARLPEPTADETLDGSRSAPATMAA